MVELLNQFILTISFPNNYLVQFNYFLIENQNVVMKVWPDIFTELTINVK